MQPIIFREGPLGRLLFLQVNALTVEGWRGEPDRAGGGALLEGGIHWVSLLTSVGAAVTSVRASTPDGRAGERSVQLLLGWEGGAIGSLAYSWEVASPLRGVRVSRAYGTDGSAVFESNGLFFATLGAPWRVRFGAADLLGYRAMFRDLRDALATGRAPAYTLSHARRDVELVLRAYGDAARRPGDGPPRRVLAAPHEREAPR